MKAGRSEKGEVGSSTLPRPTKKHFAGFGKGFDMTAVVKKYGQDDPLRLPGTAEKDESLGKLIIKDASGNITGEIRLKEVLDWWNEADK